MAAYQAQSGVAAAEAVQLGLQARRSGDRLAALTHFRTAVEAEPAGIRPRVELARELAELGRAPEAVEILKAVLKDVPDQPQAQALLTYLGRPGGKTPRRYAGQEPCRWRWLPSTAGSHLLFPGGSPV